MNFEEILIYLRKGHRVYRKSWHEELGECKTYSMWLDGLGQVAYSDKYSIPRFYDSIRISDMHANDWEVLDCQERTYTLFVKNLECLNRSSPVYPINNKEREIAFYWFSMGVGSEQEKSMTENEKKKILQEHCDRLS